jgi:NTP pyrophosphatase (non-canonical NTP hydrolase)
MTYYLYHIPGKKIGVTRDLNTRLTLYQGYKPSEYKVLEQSDDIDYISKREIELQKEYGYEADHTIFSKLGDMPKVMINSTDVTTTFRCPINELGDKLKELKGESFSNIDKKYTLDDNLIAFILRNVQPSKYRDTSCFMYNNILKNYTDKTFEIQFDDVEETTTTKYLVKEDRFQNIRNWAEERGLYKKGDVKTQYLKLMEEAGELGRAILKDDKAEFVDAIGDMVVVLTNLAHLGGTSIEECVDSAYNVISKRTGKMVNGTFVKDN